MPLPVGVALEDVDRHLQMSFDLLSRPHWVAETPTKKGRYAEEEGACSKASTLEAMMRDAT